KTSTTSRDSVSTKRNSTRSGSRRIWHLREVSPFRESSLVSQRSSPAAFAGSWPSRARLRRAASLAYLADLRSTQPCINVKTGKHAARRSRAYSTPHHHSRKG